MIRWLVRQWHSWKQGNAEGELWTYIRDDKASSASLATIMQSIAYHRRRAED